MDGKFLMIKIFLFLTLVSLPWMVLIGQGNKLADRANKFYDNYHYVDAIAKYERLLERDDDATGDIYERLAHSYYHIGDYAMAAMYYAELYKIDSIKFKYNDFKYGQSLKSTGGYAKADLYLGRYYDGPNEGHGYPPDLPSGRTKDYDVHLCAPCNTKFSEFPAFLDGSHLYVAAPNKWRLYTNSVNGLPTYDIFKLAGEAKKSVPGINSKFNEGSLTISKDKSILYFTSNEREGNDMLGNSVKPLYLYRAKNKNGRWVDIEKLPFNQKSYATMHPTLSKDGSELFFVSDMPHQEAKGGMDIYKVAVLANGSFGPVENVTGLNTIGNETYPFISEDGSLYFASNGLSGFGGMDIFRAVIEKDGNYGFPKNLGEGINSNMDDFAFVVNNWGIGYFASNRLGSLNDEIFQFSSIPIQLDTLEEPNMIAKISGVVLDGKTGHGLSEAKLTILDVNNKVLDGMLTDVGGGYKFLNIDKSKAVYLRVKKDFYDSIIIKIPKSIKTLSDFNFSLRRKDILKVIYFGFDESKLGLNDKIALDSIAEVLNGFSKIRLRLSGHTDSAGNRDYNMMLSQRRVNEVRDYLLGLGIAMDKLKVESFGESKLLDTSCKGACEKNRAVVISVDGSDINFEIIKG